MRIFMDIETVPRSVPAELLTKLQDAQANRYVKPEVIERKRAETLSKFSLHPFFAQVVCIVAHDGEREFACSAADEGFILREFQDYLQGTPDMVVDMTFAGYNVAAFDVPVLAAAYVMNNIHVPTCLVQNKYKHTDYMTMFPNAGKLGDIGTLLEIRKDSPHDGSDVAALYEAGRHQDILDHCRDDVRICRHLGEYL
jgi:predicted PolB exonuclease-like 3'-5' exonuclease